MKCEFLDNGALIVERFPGKPYFWVFYFESFWILRTNKRLVRVIQGGQHRKTTGIYYSYGYYKSVPVLKRKISRKDVERLISYAER